MGRRGVIKEQDMAKVLVNQDFLEDGLELICDKIRLKTGGTGLLAFPVEIAAAVESIATGSGGITPTGKKEITENGDNIDVTNFAAVKVAVPTGTDTSDATADAADIPADKTAYIATGKTTGTAAVRTSSDLTESGETVTVPAGLYREAASKAVAAASQAVPSVSVDQSTGLVTATVNQSAGYVAAGTESGTLQLSAKSAQTYTPGTTDQEIPAGKYTTGKQTIKGDAKLVPENIKSGVQIFNVTGSYGGSGGSGGEVRTTTSGTTVTAATTKRMRAQTIGLSTDQTFGGLIIEGDDMTGPVFGMVLIRKSSSEWLGYSWDVYGGTPRLNVITPTVTVTATTSGIYKVYTVNIELPSNGPSFSTASGNYGVNPIWAE